MPQLKRFEVAAKMQSTGVVPLYYNPDPEIVKKVVKACYDGGLRIFEFTNRGDFAHEVFGELVKWSAKHLPGMVLGVGSVVDAPTASLYIQLGASFVVSPLLNEEIAKVCNRRKILWMPGCATVSEISRAEELGAEVVKVYPASMLGGPDFIKSILGPCPWTLLMPSGGVSPSIDNLKKWFDAGAFCVGMGSKLITKDLVKANDYDTLREKAAELVEMIEKLKGT